MTTFQLRGNWDRASSLEWLEANGIGGYASSTACGANTRRYHGLLVAATRPPVGRMVLLSKLDERITAGDESFDLGTNQFPGAFHPRGSDYLESFSRGIFPTFVFSAGGLTVRKTVVAIHGENTTVILYEVVESQDEVTLELRPFVAGRDYHALVTANTAIRREGVFDGEVFSLQPYEGVPTLHLAAPGASFDPSPDWYYRFEYAREQERGLDAHEDLFTPGVFRVTIAARARYAVTASTEELHGRDAFSLIERERTRRKRLIRKLEIASPLGRTLALAADQFLVRRGTDGFTVIAGYHWFSDWGRDTMIALPGLCLTTGRYDVAKKILRTFGDSVSQGMLPNRFPEAGEAPEYNTVDATLWFFIAARKYLDYTGDEVFVSQGLLPVLREIIAWHERGTRHGIHEDRDGLLMAGLPGDQLTWMDAKVGDWVVTPRHGKPVEVNALWYNALCILAEFERRWGSPSDAGKLEIRAGRARVAFMQQFWNDEGGCLYDVVDGETKDASVRPNQIFAISLPHQIVDGPRAVSILNVVERELLTPVGLRSLSPADERFVPVYGGDQSHRDGAYHQGTVWSWLMGPFITALVRVRGEAGVDQGRSLVDGLAARFDQAGVGSISEIFDGTAPHAPRGSIAQAWSVGEILRAATEDLRLSRTHPRPSVLGEPAAC